MLRRVREGSVERGSIKINERAEGKKLTTRGVIYAGGRFTNLAKGRSEGIAALTIRSDFPGLGAAAA